MENEKNLHPRNINNKSYDFETLIKAYSKLASFVKKNEYDSLSLNYSDPKAVMCLNQALITHHYSVKDWSVPKGHLCPPVPGRADYIHYIADLLSEDGEPPVGTSIKGLDIGTGTSCIYPILGNSIYGWKFVGSDISSTATNHAKSILNSNPKLKKNIKVRHQEAAKHIFKGIIKFEEQFDFTMCNPPFYSSLKEASKNTARKINNLNKNKDKKGHDTSIEKKSNFGGVESELWCPGGEVAFIKNMIQESIEFKEQCVWFTTLVSNNSNLPVFYKILEDLGDVEVRTIEMNQGKKVSHILAWHFKINDN
jgi:23S rRNA (adenine1618-N6)-methyltransferase